MPTEEPISEEKAAATAKSYEQASGLTDAPDDGPDPVIAAQEEATADIEQPDVGEPAYINKEYEVEREQVEYNDVSGDDTEDKDSAEDEPEPKNAKKSTPKKN